MPTGAVGKLAKEHLDELQKQVGPSVHDKLITKKINALNDLSTQTARRWAHGDTPSKSTSPPSERSFKPHRKREMNSWRRCTKRNNQNDTCVQCLRRS